MFCLPFSFSPYAYNFGLGKRADTEDLSNYEDDPEFYSDANNFDKTGLNMENWENGGYMDNKNDIDVIDYDLMSYPRGESVERQQTIPEAVYFIKFPF
jgi:hypothetical protein